MKKLLIAILFLSPVAHATTTATIAAITTQQAVLQTVTTSTAACSVIVSTSPTYSPVIYDVDTTKFPGSNLDSRYMGLNNGNRRIFVIGKRAAVDVASGTLIKYSRSLGEEVSYYWQETCGADVVSGAFKTKTIQFGTSYADPRYDRNRPGEYAYPTTNFSDNKTLINDPYTGAQIKNITLPGDGSFLYEAETFSVIKTTAGATGWTVASGSATYNGSNKNYIYLNGHQTFYYDLTQTAYYQANTDLSSIQLNATIYGTASNVNVCLTLDGSHCFGATITQPITAAPTAYVIGSTQPYMKSWNNSAEGLFKSLEIANNFTSVTVAGDGRNVTNTFTVRPFSQNTSSTSIIGINGQTLAISSMTDEYDLTLSTSVTPGNYNVTMQNFGFLIWDAAGTNDTITVSTLTWTMGIEGQNNGYATGGWVVCSIVQVTGPTGLGTLCDPYGTLNGNGIYWIGEDGTANFIGPMNPNFTGTGMNVAGGSISGNIPWDYATAATYYYVANRVSDNAQVIAKTTYTGSYTPVTYPVPTVLSPSTTTAITGDLNALAFAFDSRFSSTSFNGGWQTYITSPHGLHGQLTLINQLSSQNSPSWIMIFDLNTNAVIGMLPTFLGNPGTANRWFGLHGLNADQSNTGWINPAMQNDLPYFVSIATNGFGASLQNCPANPVDQSVVGQALCSSMVGVSTTVPNSGTSSLFNIAISSGDYMRLYNNGNGLEMVRILTIFGSTMTVERCMTSFNGDSCSDRSGLSLQLYVEGHYASGDLHWDYVDDPHGNTFFINGSSTVVIDAVTSDCHQIYGPQFGIFPCLYPQNVYPIRADAYKLRTTLSPNFSTTFTFAPAVIGFAGDNTTIGTNIVGQHPSAPMIPNGSFQDTHPVMGVTSLCAGSGCTKVAGTTSIFKVAASNVTGANLNYRVRPFVFISGEKNFSDVSPAVLTDTVADNYKFCYVVTAGDCWAGSAANEIYANSPLMTVLAANFSFLPNYPYTRDMNVGTMEGNFDYLSQMYGGVTQEWEGKNERQISTNFKISRVGVNYDNSRLTVGGGWFLQNTYRADLMHNTYYIDKVPSVLFDSKSRFTYSQVPITVSGKTGDQIRIRFGYQEYGQPNQLFCSPRQMQCSTDATLTMPYLWSDETQQWKTCSSGCSINLPVLPEHIAYYVVDRKNNGAITTSPIQWATGE